MSRQLIRKIQRHGSSNVLPIPAEFRKLGYVLGAEVEFGIYKRSLYISVVKDKVKTCPTCHGDGNVKVTQ